MTQASKINRGNFSQRTLLTVVAGLIAATAGVMLTIRPKFDNFCLGLHRLYPNGHYFVSTAWRDSAQKADRRVGIFGCRTGCPHKNILTAWCSSRSPDCVLMFVRSDSEET
jgi:hypothetical protein